MVEQLLPEMSQAKRLADSKPAAEAVSRAAADPLAEVHRLYQQGLYLQAYAKAETIGPLRDWRGPAGRAMAGRLAHVLGDGRLGRAIHISGMRENPADPLARYYGLRAVFQRRGPWNARRLWQQTGRLTEGPKHLQADWLSFYALLSATLRDFEVADQCIDEALALAPDRPWVHVERSSILQIEDRFEEALAAAERSLDLRPWFRPGVQSAAEYLCRLNRDREAIDLLVAASERLECGNIVAQLATVQRELELEGAARESLARLGELLPLQDKALASWIAGVECDLNSQRDDLEAAIAAGRRAKSPYYNHVVANLEAANLGVVKPTNKRVLLPVDFVQQKHVTCAPATIAAICKFWRHEAGHVEIADQICYDGTPQHRQRDWAEANGFLVRQFSVDWNTALALIDRGAPFTLVTVQPPNSHLVAVIGYDARRGTLLLRDPSLRCRSEMIGKEGLEAFRSTGPLGMVIVPRDRAALLDGVALPDADLYDDLHAVQTALDAHQRDRAHEVLTRMREANAEHRVTLYARRALAAYDSDMVAARQAYEQLLKQFPEDTLLLLARVAVMRDDSTRQDRIDFLTEIEASPRRNGLFRLQLAEELLADARCHAETARLLRRLFIQRPYEGRCYYAQARIAWAAGDFVKGTELYRCAACLNDTNDQYARDWFLASRHVKQGDQSLAFLQSRFERYGHKSNRPAVTLANAFNDLGLGQEALRVLEEAIRRRPDDGELMVFTADSYSCRGDFSRAKSLLTEAKGHSRRGSWLRIAAGVAAAEGDLPLARQYRTELAEFEPQAADNHNALYQLLEALDGQDAAFEHLRSAVARMPNNFALLRLTVDKFNPLRIDEAESMIRRLLEINPTDAWAHRELASLLASRQRFDEAIVEADTAIALSPAECIGYGMRGFIRERAGDIAQAMADYRLAVEHSADDEQAIRRLVYCAATHADRSAALEFVHDQLKRQTTFGTGILTYRDQARGVLKPDDVLAQLRDAFAARPDLWHAWSALARQLADMDQLDEAVDVALAATAKFPLMPRLWCDLALVRRAAGDSEGEIAALESALRINPNWSVAICALANALQRAGKPERERSVLESAAARTPLEGVLRCYLSDTLWRAAEREKAVESLELAVRNLPDNDQAWDMLAERAQAIGAPERAVKAARDAVARFSGDWRAWLRLAQMLRAPEAFDERMAALDRATQLHPRAASAHALRAELLRAAKRFADARAACSPPSYGERPPAELRLEAARVSAAEGKLPAAIAEARAIVEENPDFYAGWQQLCDWYALNPANAKELLEAAEHLTARFPKDANAWRYTGDAQVRLKNRDEAKQAYRRSIELNPTWAYSRRALFDLYFEDKDFDAAEQVLQRALETDRDAFTLVRHIQMLSIRRKGEEAAAALAELCKLALPNKWPLAKAVEAMVERRWRGSVRLALSAAMNRPGASPQIAAEWATIEVSMRQWRRAIKQLKTLRGNDTAWPAAAAVVLNGMAEAKKKFAARWFIHQNRARLRKDVGCWGTAGFALLKAGQWRAVADWLADWKTRKGVQPWMLTNLAISLVLLGRYDEAADVHRNAIKLGTDQTTVQHKIYLAALEAAAGRFDEAKRLIDQTTPEKTNEFPRAVRALVAETLALRDDASLGRVWFPSRAAKQRLERALRSFRTVRASNAYFRRTASRVVRRVARDRGWWLLRLLSI